MVAVYCLWEVFAGSSGTKVSLISSIRPESVRSHSPSTDSLTKYDQIVSVNENQSNYKNILPSNIFPLTVMWWLPSL